MRISMICFRFRVAFARASCVVAPLAAVVVLGGCDCRSGGASAAEGGCPAAWLQPPSVSPSIAVPADGGRVLAHGAATGTQDYRCQAAADGGSTWVLVGPRASLRDCTGALLAEHFASDAGAALPEWQSPDHTYVVGRKVAASAPDASPSSVPWVLLEGVSHGGAGALSRVRYVQRVNTSGGVAPARACAVDATAGVPYRADYYFYGP